MARFITPRTASSKSDTARQGTGAFVSAAAERRKPRTTSLWEVTKTVQPYAWRASPSKKNSRRSYSHILEKISLSSIRACGRVWRQRARKENTRHGKQFTQTNTVGGRSQAYSDVSQPHRRCGLGARSWRR